MARLPRLTLAGQLHHVLQRGNNGQPIFASVADHALFLSLLTEHAAQLGVAVHAYVLLGNEFQLLLTPATDDGLPLLMQALSRRYVRHFNTAHGRTGTLWDGRYRSTVLEAAAWLLPSMVSIDLAPVTAGAVGSARDHPWSSHGHHAGLRVDRLITPHSLFWTLGNTPFAREAAYSELVRAGLPSLAESALKQAVMAGWALGGEEFLSELQKRSSRRLLKSTPGRPAAPSSER